MSRGRLRFSVAIMAKAPIAGFAKTRLIPLLGPAGAARAQRGFILRTLAIAAAAAPESITLWCAPDPRQRFFRALRRRIGTRADACEPIWRRQRDGDLGRRMADTFAAHDAKARSAPATPLLLLGTDCPVLEPAHLHQAARALADGADAVFGPVEDGGYVLVGLRDAGTMVAPIFAAGINWSTARVMAQTRARLVTAGACWHELAVAPPLWDVDEPADWLRWQQTLDAAARAPA